jgi:hypothetical protein
MVNLGKVMVPLSQLQPDIHFTVRSFGRLLDGTDASHQPVIFTRSTTGYGQIQKQIDTVVHNLCRFDLVDSVPKGHLAHYPVVHGSFPYDAEMLSTLLHHHREFFRLHTIRGVVDAVIASQAEILVTTFIDARKP